MKTSIKLADLAVPLATSRVRYTALAGLLSLALFTASYAADFSGSLNSVSITDLAGANKAPSAVINYTKDGNTFVFDASKSSDPDGNIVKYTWDFGDSTQALGLTAAHNFAAVGVYNVSLTVVDDKGGAAIAQVQLNTTSGFSDDFSTDTSANYTRVGANTATGIAIASGVAKGLAQYQANLVIRGTTGSNDHYAQADVELATASGSGIIIGATAPGPTTTGYFVAITATWGIKLFSFSGDTVTNTGKYWDVKIANNTLYSMKVVKTGSSFALYLDTGGGLTHVGTDISDSTYSTGSYVGLAFNQAAGYTPRIDNFRAGL